MMRTMRLIAVLSVLAAAPSRAAVLFESDPDQSSGFAAFTNAGSTAVGLLSVSANRTIGAIGVLDNLENGAHLKFFIADAGTGALLYLSAPQYFAAEAGGPLNLTYKVSAGLSFTFLPGMDYAVGSIADDVAYTYVDPFQTNMAGGFSSLLGNLTVSSYAAPTVDTGQNCCSVGFELLDAPTSVPEPLSAALFGTGLVGAALLRRRPRAI